MQLLSRVAKTIRENDLRSITRLALAMVEDAVFDLRYGVDTSGKTHLDNLAVAGQHVANAVHYQPMRARYFRVLMQAVEVPHGSVFVDFGSGKGRALLLAALSGRFKKVVGVEFSADLCRAAERNIHLFQKSHGTKVNFEINTADAADYQVQADQNVFFLFNPFDHVVMEGVLEHIESSLAQHPRPIWLMYLHFMDRCLKLIEGKEGYVEVRRLRYGNERLVIFVNSGAQYGPTKARDGCNRALM